MRDDGAQRPLEVEIDRKVYESPSGEALEAVRNLSFRIAPHEIVCLIGPSGCGKTTTLRILLGLDRDFEGRVRPDPDELALGMVFQEPRLLPWRTVEENIRLVLRPARRARPLDALLADVGLDRWRGRYPWELSLGMARRVALARALAIEPEVLILDEPFTSLDERAAAELRELVFATVIGKRMTALMVTHDVREALAIADRLILLTPRPATVLADVPIAAPRAARDQEWIEGQRRALAERFPSR
jgi:ABC-type nitrate/sulfonate/bicarbonate transport system ATPase subunit